MMVVDKGAGIIFPMLTRLMCSITGWLGNSLDPTQDPPALWGHWSLDLCRVGLSVLRT